MRRSISPFAAAAITLFLAIGGYPQSESVSKLDLPSKGDDVAASDSKKKPVTIEKVERDMAEALSLIEEHHFEGSETDYNALFKSVIDTMLHTLDPHSNYFDAKEFRQFQTNQNSKYFGIGATIGDLRDANGKVVATYIKSTFHGAPANRAGLRYGDKIVEVNGQSMLGKPYYTVRDFLRGPKGTPAVVLIERNGTGERETVEIVRDGVSTPSIPEVYMFRPEVGYIAMTGGFNRTTYNEFAAAMKELKAAGMKRLVLDLRGNGGGLVNQAFWVANTFLKEGQAIFTQKGRKQGRPQTFSSDNRSPDSTPLIVMVNGSTASASEILAGALQDHDRALIVGENSFGKGLVQNPYPLEYGSMLLLTIAKYETPSGRLIQKDYSDGNLYNYYTNGGSFEDSEKPKQNRGPESRTDSGRIVYGGGGIAPDVKIESPKVSSSVGRFQQKLLDPLFSFVLKLAAGEVKGFESFAVDKPVVFNYDIKAGDFPVSDALVATFTDHASKVYGLDAKKVRKESKFIKRIIRTELVTAAYGSQTSFQVFNEFDPQLNRAVKLFPQAERLARYGTIDLAVEAASKN
ncbi:MAG: S41 family peptidase [Pyrinomonadaceae bacterium]|nr:S41 family peptidase [Pyrinomonadaceae bacterium]